MRADQQALWAMDRAFLEGMPRSFTRGGQRPTAEQLEQRRAQQAAVLAAVIGQAREAKGKVAVVPVRGIIEQRCSDYGWFFGGCSTEQVGECLDALAASADVEAVVLDVDSPGGVTYGTSELSDKIFALKAVKPIYSISNSLMASAAYWLGSQCSKVYCTPSGDVGSIGVYAAHVEFSKADEAAGVAVTIISAGKYKIEGNDSQPLTDEAKAYIQFVVDETYTKFVQAVARGRGTTAKAVAGGFGEGRVLMADAAKAAGLIDGVMSLDALLASLGGQPVPASAYDRMMQGGGSKRAQERARWEWEKEKERAKMLHWEAR
jgi:signal peptide peptidase SppA